MKIAISLTFVIYFIICEVNGYRILVMTMFPSKSHHYLNMGITDTLEKAGHEVTNISPFSRKDSRNREISVPRMLDYTNKGPLVGFPMSNLSNTEMLMTLVDWHQQLAEAFHNNPEVSSFLSDKSQKFDLVFIDYITNEYIFGLGVKYDCPIVVLSSFNMITSLAKMMGNPYSVATVSDVFLGLSFKMSLYERVYNFLSIIMVEVIEDLLLDPVQMKLYEKYFPEESKIVSYTELKKRISFVFMNTHPTMEVARPLLPNIVEIGGYHVNEPGPLPKDLQEIMNSAKHGVVFMSFGTILKTNEMDLSLRNSILKAFSKLKQTVLWKSDVDFPDKPKNVIINKWMPQSSILAHPNLKLFITHGGMLSCIESVHYGKPVIVVPVIADQYHSAKMAVARGQGLEFNLNNLTESSLGWAMNEVLLNPKYAEAAIRTQKVFLDRPVKPRDLIAYYVEHVIRTNGAPHLQQPKLSMWSLMLLDVYAVILIPLIIVFYLMYMCCRKVFCKNTKLPVGKYKKSN